MARHRFRHLLYENSTYEYMMKYKWIVYALIKDYLILTVILKIHFTNAWNAYENIEI